MVSAIVVFTAIALAVVNSPGWETVKSAFFNRAEARDVLPLVARAFLLNMKMFTIAEVLILAFALLLAVVRSLPGPVFFPLRLMVIVYTDFFRGVPTILVVYVLGFGMPGLQLPGSRPTPSSGVWSRSCSSTAPTSPRCTGPGSSRCTRARRPRPARSGSRAGRRCASSSSPRRCAG